MEGRFSMVVPTIVRSRQPRAPLPAEPAPAAPASAEGCAELVDLTAWAAAQG